MRIEIKPDGTTIVDSNGSTPGEVAAFTLSLQRELRDQVKAEVEEAQALSRPASLNDIQGATYDWMVAHDREQGIHIGAIARAFQISNGAAGQRCYQLVKDGFATKICNGRYRPVVEG